MRNEPAHRFGHHLYSFSFFFVLVLHARTSFSQKQPCNSNDFDSLKGIYSSLQSKAVLGWSWNDSSSDCCNWIGVLCDSIELRVIGLDLSNKSLKGYLTDSFTGLNHLKSLNLSSNLFVGSAPSSLFQLPKLESLDLSLNSFSGPIPPIIRLPSVRTFNLSFNSFNGSYPVLSNSSNLQIFDISNNHELTGTLSDDLFVLSNLTKLNLQWNSFYGTINPNLGNLSNLVDLELSNNNFSGIIPDVFDKLRKLETFCASSNKLTGFLPSSLSSVSTLKVLSLRNNSLNGDINLNFSSLPKLNTLDLGTNHFNGTIPANLSLCWRLQTLNLARNNLLGEIPSSFKNITSLTYLSLTGNKFSNITLALQILQNLPNLSILVLTKNFQSGETIPFEGINGFLSIEVFVIANCALYGSVPPWLRNLKKLNVLDISWNRLNGTIPPWLGNFDNLFYLDISNNSLTGEIPPGLAQIKCLMISGTLSKQRASMEELPFFMKRNSTAQPLQYNQISSFPPSLVLSHNLLVGPVLLEFGNLTQLLLLDLSYNNLTGTIPSNLAGMSNLETLDLSHNDLSGIIPSSLTKLNFLSKFDVADNDLTGDIPTGGQFSTFPADYFEGNPNLCWPHFNNSCKNQSNVATSTFVTKHKNIGVILGPVLGISIGLTFLTFFFVILSKIKSKEKNRKAVANADDSSSETGASRLVLLFQNKDNANKELITIEDVIKSTNNFDQGYIIGCGGFGLVYKSVLPNGRCVAIKRLSGDFCQIEREFQAEVETLSRVRHENLVLLEGYCKIGTDRLLIYSYMENGSLDYWLHEKTDGPGLLDWSTRLHVARGAARGLFYLHQSCDPHILHRDIKSSNILLDGSFNAHLADFGLARLILPYDTHVTTDVVGTLGYIPPEYSQSPLATFKGDVYSFGVVLLELVTGHRPVDMCRPKGSRDVVSWVLSMKRDGREKEVFDENVLSEGKSVNLEEVVRMLDIACLCVMNSPKSRPLAHQLVQWLDEIGVEGK